MSKSDKKPAKVKEQGKGIVKAVPAGDRIVIYCPEGPSKTKEIKFSSVEAPRKGWGDQPEQAYAWQSRNFLRELLIGKSVAYLIDSKVGDSDSGKQAREYGTVLLGSKNVTHTALEAGWIQIKRSEKPDWKPNPILAELEDKARAEKRGIWNTSEEALADAFHPPITVFDGWEKFKSWQGKTFLALVEHVFTGSKMKISLLPSFHELVVKIAGVQSPIKTKKRTEPYAEEAQNTTTRYLLHRVVHVTFNAFEKDPDTFYGVISLNGKPIANELLKSGLARFVEWSAPKDQVATMKAIQAKAQKEGQRMWKSGIPKPRSSTDSSFTGFVRQVVNGGTLKVQREGRPLDELETVYLSSLDVPRMGSRDSPDSPFAFEAREFVRRKVIGKKVLCSLDYVIPSIKVPARKGGANAKGKGKGKGEKKGEETPGDAKSTPKERVLPAKPCYTVFVGERNIALGLVEHGFAKVVEHRGQERSPHYNAFLLAQERAKDKRLGVHQPSEEHTPRHVNDLSRRENQKQAKLLGASLIRKKGRMKGIVEYVFNATRFKIQIPSENVMIAFALAGVRVNPPGARQNDDKNKEKKIDPPYVAEALNFAKRCTFQYDVEIEIEGQDKYGTIIGHLFYKKKFNVGLQLLDKGYGELGRFPEKYRSQFEDAQRKAKESNLGRWIDWSSEKEEALQKESSGELSEPKKANSEKALVQVTEILSANWFYVQLAGEAAQQPLKDMMKAISEKDWSALPPHSPKKGEVVIAQFSGDKTWYRALVSKISKEDGITVFFGDYGNSETTQVAVIRKMETEFNISVLPWQAFECSLAYIKPRTLEQDYGEDAALCLKALVWDKTLAATIEYRDGGALFLNLFVPSEEGDENPLFVNGTMVREGLAKVQTRLPRKTNRDMVKYLKEEQEAAHAEHLGFWRYGDPDDEEDVRRRPRD